MEPQALALAAAFLMQNLAEWRGGGPDLPPRLSAWRLIPPDPARLRGRALLIVSGVILAAMAAAAGAEAAWQRAVLAMIAGALGWNAVAQAAASAAMRRWLPGTGAGVVLMLPAAVVLTLGLGRRAGALPWGWLAAGIALGAPVLVAVWWLAHLSRRVASGRDG